MVRRIPRALVMSIAVMGSAAALAEAPAPVPEAGASHPPGCADLAGIVSRELMQRPAALTPVPGHLHQKVSTGDADAQAYYDQGIAWLASYVWVEAARSLHEALRHDPELAMAHLMLAKAYAGAEAADDAREHLKRASELAAGEKVTPKEAKWIALGVMQSEAVAAGGKERAGKHEAYKKAIDDLIKMDPDDPFAWILRGNAEEPGAWGRGQVGGVGSIAFYEAALRRDPDNLAAHHFLVHSYENIGRHEEASEHGRIYADAAPGVPHAQHMYGHVLPRLGQWQEALKRFGEADRLEREYYKAEGIGAEEDWHHGHNLQLLGMVQLRLGNDAEAERLFKEAFELPQRSRQRGGTNLMAWPEFLMLRGRFDEAARIGRELQANDRPFDRFAGAVIASEALLAQGLVKESRDTRRRADKAYADIRRAVRGTPYESLTPSYLGPVVRMLDAQLALHGGKGSDGGKDLLKIADDLAGNPRFDAWGEGLFRLERAAAEAVRAGQPKVAEQLVERMHRIDPDFVSAAIKTAPPPGAKTDATSGKR